jgi:hypothetical protein
MVDWTSLISVFLGFKSDLRRPQKCFGWFCQFVAIALEGGAERLNLCRSDGQNRKFPGPGHARLAQLSPPTLRAGWPIQRSSNARIVVLAGDMPVVVEVPHVALPRQMLPRQRLSGDGALSYDLVPAVTIAEPQPLQDLMRELLGALFGSSLRVRRLSHTPLAEEGLV